MGSTKITQPMVKLGGASLPEEPLDLLSSNTLLFKDRTASWPYCNTVRASRWATAIIAKTTTSTAHHEN